MCWAFRRAHQLIALGKSGNAYRLSSSFIVACAYCLGL
jgi:hypothetical protein